MRRWWVAALVGALMAGAVIVAVAAAVAGDRGGSNSGAERMEVFHGPATFCQAERAQAMVDSVRLVEATSTANGLRSRVAHVRAQVVAKLARSAGTSRRVRATLRGLARQLEVARRTGDFGPALTTARWLDWWAVRRCR